MSDSRSFAALEWVVHEIVDTLKEARDALESYVENPQDEALLRFCLTHIHQVHGSLQMVQFHGAAMMAEEMEQLAQAMINDGVANPTEAQEVLMRAILQFPVYLENVKTSRRDNPIVVLPLLNDLRAVRGETLLTETKLFSPHLAPAHKAEGQRLPLLDDSARFQDTARKLRQMYQYAAAGFIRGANQEENLAYLKKVFQRLDKLSRGTVRQSLWDIALALVEALEMDAVESSVSIKNLLRQLDREIKRLITGGAAVLDERVDDQLLKNLLYYVARSGKHTPGFPEGSALQRVYHRYELEQALPEGRETGGEDERSDLLSAPDAGAIGSVVTALKTELDSIKQALDVSLSGVDREQAMRNALPVTKRVADTMAVLGIGELRKQMLDQGEYLERALETGELPDDDELMEVASRMLEIESGLDALVATEGRSTDGDQVQAQQHLTQAHESVLRESRSGLEQAKDSIVEYIASQWDDSHLRSVPDTLRGIRGGLDMIPMARPARIIGACARYIEDQLLGAEQGPEWSQLDTLADVITGVEYYLERYTSAQADDNDLLLELAEKSLEELGYAVAPSQRRAESAETPPPAPEVDLTSDLPDDEDSEALSEAYESALGEQEQEEEAPAEEAPPPESPGDEGYSVETLSEGVAAADAEEEAQTGETADSSSGEATGEDTAAQESADEEDDDGEVDEEIAEIFVEEAGEVQEAIDEFFPRWAEDFSDQEALTEFRRAFHTLKGSGRMVGATDIGELAWSIENMLNRVLEGTTEPSDQHVAVVQRVRDILPDLVKAFSTGSANPHPETVDACARFADAMARGETPEPLPTGDAPASQPDEAQPAGEEAAELASGETEPADSRSREAASEPEEDDDDDRGQLWEIFGGEALTHLEVVEQYIAEMEEAAPLYTPPSDATQRALHTLKGSAHMANITHVAEMVTPLERFVKELRSYQVDIDDDILQLLRDGVDYTRGALVDIEQGRPVEIPKLSQFLARVAELREKFVGPLIRQEEASGRDQKSADPNLLSIFMAEELNLLLDADRSLAQWRDQPEDLTPLEPLREELAKLTHGAREANLPPMAELGSELHRVYEAIFSGQIEDSEALHSALEQAHATLLDLLDAAAVGQSLDTVPESVREPLARLLASVDEAPSEPTAPAEQPAEADEPTESSAEEPADSDQATEPAASEPEAAEAPPAAPEPPQSGPPEAAHEEDEVDEEILEIFLEEAEDLLEDIDRALAEWQDDWNNADLPEELKRSLHTLKGGARLAGVTDVGDLAHDFETLLIGMGERDTIDRAFFQRLTDFQDRIHAGVTRVQQQYAGETPEAPTPAPEGEERAPAPVQSAQTEQGNVVPFASKAGKPGATATGAPPAPPAGGGKMSAAGGGGGGQAQPMAAKRGGPQEVVRVSADLLEELVNLAGETSITRGRIEEQVGDLGMALGEMDSTISRLQEQLRRLDIETEAQVLFRQEQMEAHDEFDPLEMDRYSALQQLSRSLMESASDLLDLKNTLSDKSRDTETLLLQQSRINTDLQEGLMRSRMVPFSRLVPRLRRIVRQAATELGKEVDFQLDNVEGELDRSVLERMVAPLEHMLRNAVDHGIEPPEEREGADKARAGRILLSLAREGGEVVLRLQDDGRGIDLERVKAKAIERGLMTENAQLSDRDIMQFILHAGFSTADKVTQISGRGVGMDVVHSEIKQLGGSMFINSEHGSGSEFIVRLPFTVSVNRALMIQIGDDNYAVPLNTIEGIVRVSPFELEHYYTDENARFEYAGEEYQVRYLGTMLDSDARPKLDGQSLPLPVVLVRSAEHTVALQVDRLLGSSEIVVKTLGAQFAAVSGVSGATVMGDGSVVVILDPHALMREKLALGMPDATLLEPAEPAAEVEDDEERERVVMVVDDSVTVRKVTGRFLEREGYRVITAKDGAEALMTLQDHVPDVMLLDIEMPRMDGFEVATNIRTGTRLKDLPIIMITSRTGDKHRERAFHIGVNRYLGKPYQEEQLLQNIRELLDPSKDE